MAIFNAVVYLALWPLAMLYCLANLVGNSSFFFPSIEGAPFARRAEFLALGVLTLGCAYVFYVCHENTNSVSQFFESYTLMMSFFSIFAVAFLAWVEKFNYSKLGPALAEAKSKLFAQAAQS